MKFLKLSYIIDSATPAYGNQAHLVLERVSDMNKGATANKTSIAIDSHTGTHLDFPLHFLADGKAGERYEPQELVFNHVRLAEIAKEGGLITVDDLSGLQPDNAIDLLIIKTGFCYKRNETAYWENNPGFASDTAVQLKKLFPELRAVGFDSISLSSYQNRAEGRIAHREFLSRDLLIIEDMDLRNVNEQTRFVRLFVAPLLFASCDGAPCYILAETDN